MSLTLRLYNTSSPSNKINKDLTLKGGLLINLKNRPKDFNELDIDYTGNTGSVALDFNYAHLVEYNLYFFAKMLPSNTPSQYTYHSPPPAPMNRSLRYWDG